MLRNKLTKVNETKLTERDREILCTCVKCLEILDIGIDIERKDFVTFVVEKLGTLFELEEFAGKYDKNIEETKRDTCQYER